MHCALVQKAMSQPLPLSSFCHSSPTSSRHSASAASFWVDGEVDLEQLFEMIDADGFLACYGTRSKTNTCHSSSATMEHWR